MILTLYEHANVRKACTINTGHRVRATALLTVQRRRHAARLLAKLPATAGSGSTERRRVRRAPSSIGAVVDVAEAIRRRRVEKVSCVALTRPREGRRALAESRHGKSHQILAVWSLVSSISSHFLLGAQFIPLNLLMQDTPIFDTGILLVIFGWGGV